MSNVPETIIIPGECHGLRLDQALSKMYPHISRSRWGEWLKNGYISYRGVPCRAKDKSQTGMQLSLLVNPEDSLRISEDIKAQNIPLDIVYEDNDILVINKPSGLVVHPGAGNPEDTLLNALLHHNPNADTLIRAGIIHRLDKETTGVMIVAKSTQAQTRLIQDLQAREIHREYLALVYGHIISGASIETYYGRHPKNRLKMAVLPSGREAITHFKIEKHYGDFTLLKVSLETGRTHQIRVHLSHIKHPIVGDPLYGKRLAIPKDAEATLKTHLQCFKRQALHAYSLRLRHPITQEECSFQAPPPDDFSQLLQEMDAHYEHHPR